MAAQTGTCTIKKVGFMRSKLDKQVSRILLPYFGLQTMMYLVIARTQSAPIVVIMRKYTTKPHAVHITSPNTHLENMK